MTESTGATHICVVFEWGNTTLFQLMLFVYLPYQFKIKFYLILLFRGGHCTNVCGRILLCVTISE